MQGWATGLVQESFAVILALNIGAGRHLGKQEGSFANSSARLLRFIGTVLKREKKEGKSFQLL